MCPYVKLNAKEIPTFDDENVGMDKIQYALVLGSLMYVMVATRLYIGFRVGVVSKYMENLGKWHCNERFYKIPQSHK